MSGEKLSADESEVSEFIQTLSKRITELDLTPEQLYNADETCLNWRQLPTKTIITPEEKKVSGRKLQKERITLIVCANASGTHKLKLLVVGMSKKPRALKSVKILTLSVTYMYQNCAWVTKEVFLDWYKNNFVLQVKDELRKKLPKKAHLLLDNVPGHPDKDELKIKTANQDCGV
ncbi:jerky protein homolog-like [Centruroides sculpturatus]|uniref:jerky protein homolog-like n=1 Tax=Centruroides sculpturatus TaxID=218467 RepID=UPI000C6ECCE1|nr:jerky protein homolog-like [Centruroides sculpturatus]